jgi:hypothetical protein
MMTTKEELIVEKRQLSLVAAIYYAVMLAGLVLGLFGLISLLTLASDWAQNVPPPGLS